MTPLALAIQDADDHRRALSALEAEASKAKEEGRDLGDAWWSAFGEQHHRAFRAVNGVAKAREAMRASKAHGLDLPKARA